MTAVYAIAALYILLPAVSGKTNPDSIQLQEFSHRVAGYARLHDIAAAEIHGLKPTNSPDAIEHYQRRLARRIRESRNTAGPGNIFTAEIAAVFRRVISGAMQGPDAVRIRASLQRGAPARLPAVRVNFTFPPDSALPSMPPSLLLDLPPLPKELDYRVVGTALVLRDVDANLIVDYILNAVS